MKAAFTFALPVAFLLLVTLLQFPVDAAAEAAEAPSLSQQTTSDAQESSRVKRGGFNMMRLARGIHMLRLGKRSEPGAPADDTTAYAPTPNLSPESFARLEELYQSLPEYSLPYPEVYQDGDGLDDTGDDTDSYYYPILDDFEDEHFRYRRSEPGADDSEGQLGYSSDADGIGVGVDGGEGTWKRSRSRMSMLRLGKRQDEANNDEFTDGKRFARRQMSMLRLGKRPMNMLRLGKRPMNMLRLGKRPMNMLRLGKRPMNMLRLGKRQMSMLRLGKRQMSMLRLGKRPMNMLRLGKRPMNMLRLGKRPMNMLRLGKRSIDSEEPSQNVATA